MDQNIENDKYCINNVNTKTKPSFFVCARIFLKCSTVDKLPL